MELEDQKQLAPIVAAILATAAVSGAASPQTLVKRYRDMLRELEKGGGLLKYPAESE